MAARKPANKALPKYWRQKNGSYMYRVPRHLQERHGGRQEISLGQTLAQAYRTFAELHESTDRITLMHELFDRYRFEVVPGYESANTRDSKERSLTRLRASLGDNTIQSMDSPVIYEYKAHIGKTRSKTIANRDLECLSHVFTNAIEWGLLKHHPMTGKQVTKFSLPGRDRYVEDWEIKAWASVASPFLVAYVTLKGVTGLRQQDLLTLRNENITETELISVNLKTGKKLRFPLYINNEPTTVMNAVEIVRTYYASQKKQVDSPWLFHTRKGGAYYDIEKRRAPGFKNIWKRSMDKAIANTELTERFTEHDLRGKVGSDLDSDVEAQEQLAHSDTSTTRKHYRRKGSIIKPGKGFF